MKITLITDLYSVKEDDPHTPRTLYDFVQSWRADGHDVSVIKPNFILNSFIRKKPFYKTGKYGDILNLNFHLPFIFISKKVKAELKDSIIIAHMPSGILFADKLNLPFVAGIHQSDIDVLTKPIYKFYFGKRLYKALKNAYLISCRSEHLKKKLLNLYPEFENKTFIASSGIDEEIILEREILLSNPTKVFTCANFKRRKNIDKIIEAIGGDKNFTLTIAGSGEREKYLHKLAKNFNNINFLGQIKNKEVLKYMRKSDIFILPSVNETLGIVYLEAMASGCITVGTKDTGIDGIIKDNENGFLIKPETDDIKDILYKIKSMDNNELKALQDNSFQTIRNYTKIICAKNYLQHILKFRNETDLNEHVFGSM